MSIDYSIVGRRIAKCRKEMGLRQFEVAEKIGVNDKHISNIETGRCAPSLELIMKLCDVLQTTPNDILLGTETPKDDITCEALTEKIAGLDRESMIILNSIIELLDRYN